MEAPSAPARSVAGPAQARGSVGGGYRGLALQGGRDGAGEFCTPDEQERDGDGGQSGQPGNPERPLEPAGERGGRCVALAQQDTGVGRGDGGSDSDADRPADLLGGVEQSRGDPGVMIGDTGQGPIDTGMNAKTAPPARNSGPARFAQ